MNNPLKYSDPSGYNYKPIDWNGGSGGALSINPYFHSGYQGNLSPASGNHWSNQYNSEYVNFMLTNSTTFDNMYGQGASDIVLQIIQYPDIFNKWQKGNTNLNNIKNDGGFWVKEEYNETVGENKWYGVSSTNNQIAGGGVHWSFIDIDANASSSGGGALGWASDASIGVNAFMVGNGAKTELLDYAVRTNYKSARTASQFNKLRPSQQAWRTTNTLGKTGAQYLKYPNNQSLWPNAYGKTFMAVKIDNDPLFGTYGTKDAGQQIIRHQYKLEYRSAIYIGDSSEPTSILN